MILESIRVREYKNIRDSGDVEIHDEVTCLVGKNESGKTSLLEALYRLNPLATGHPETFAGLRDYPRRRYARDRQSVPGVRPITATFILEDEDVRAVENVLGHGALVSRRITVSRSYDQEISWEVGGDVEECRSEPQAPVAEPPSESSSAGMADRVLVEKHDAASAPEFQDDLSQTHGDSRLIDGARRILEQRLPGFLYFDEYSVMTGRLSISELQGGDERALSPSERTALSFLRLANVDLADLDTSAYDARKASLEAAANDITDEVLRYWSQNPWLSVDLDLDFDARVDDAPFLDIRIRNQRHRLTLNFSERSHGFTWFFSFLAALSELRRSERTVLLLDEPGLGLHPGAQSDLLRFIDERLAPSHQVVYSTHSPFMVPATELERVRTVEDRDGVGTHVSRAFFDHSEETRLPVQASLGRELVRSLHVGPDTLLVEGPSDHMFLTALSTHLQERGRSSLDSCWTVVPVGGLSGVCAFAALLQTCPNVAIIADLHGREDHITDTPVGREMFAREGIVRLTDITGTEEADIEDFFEESFYLELVNRSNAAAVEFFEMKSSGRIVERIEHAIGARFNRYLPARFLLENPDVLSEGLDDTTLDRFEALFRRVNGSIGAR